jgi:hypothetical protein
MPLAYQTCILTNFVQSKTVDEPAVQTDASAEAVIDESKKSEATPVAEETAKTDS